MKVFKIVQSCCITALLSSCAAPGRVQLYNNTGVPIKVILYHDRTGIGAGEIVDVAPGGSEAAELPSSYAFNRFGIYRPDRDILSWYWFPRFLQDGYIRHTGVDGFYMNVGIQVEASGKVYLLPDGERFPLRDLRTQPWSFPLEPTREYPPTESQRQDPKWRDGGRFRPLGNGPRSRFGNALGG